MNNIIYAIVFIGGFVAILSFISYRQTKSSWTGVVSGKSHTPADENGAEIYSLIFKTDAGKTVSLPVFENMYNEFAVGDKATKKSGSGFPEKIK